MLCLINFINLLFWGKSPNDSFGLIIVVWLGYLGLYCIYILYGYIYFLTFVIIIIIIIYKT